MAETRLIPGNKGNAYFVTRRFDRRSGNRRRHVHSVAGLVHSDFRMPDFDYVELLKLSDWLTRSHAEKTELFRRMVFNIVGGNRDDHTKNFAFEMKPVGEWVNTPAYDLTYNPGLAGHHSMTIQGKGRDFVRDDPAEAGPHGVHSPRGRPAHHRRSIGRIFRVGQRRGSLSDPEGTHRRYPAPYRPPAHPAAAGQRLIRAVSSVGGAPPAYVAAGSIASSFSSMRCSARRSIRGPDYREHPASRENPQ